MASLSPNLPAIAVRSEDTSQSNTALVITQFGARSRPDSSSELEISGAHPVEGPPLPSSPVAPLHLSQFLSSDDNTFNGATSRAPSRQSLCSNPESIFLDFGVDESRSSIYDHVASPSHTLSNQFNDLGITSPRSAHEFLNDRSTLKTFHDIPTSIPQNPDGIGPPLPSLRYNDGFMGGSPTSYHGLQVDQSHSPFIGQIPNVISNNSLGLTYGNGYPGGSPAPGMFFVGQGQNSSHPHAPSSPITHFSLDPHTRPCHGLPRPGMDISDERPSFTPAHNTGDWHSWLSSLGLSTLGMDANDVPAGNSYDAPESHAEEAVHFPSRPGGGFPPPGADVDRGRSGGRFISPASYSGKGVHFPSHCSCRPPPQGVDASHGLFGVPQSAPESCTEDGSHLPSRSSSDLPPQVVDVGHGSSGGPRSAQASFPRDGTDLRWCSRCNLPIPGKDASNGPSNGPHSAPASYPSNSLPGHTSAFSTFSSYFEDQRRDLMHDTIAAASSSSAVSGSPGDTAVLSSPHKKTVSTPKHRKAAERRRKHPARFACCKCEATFTSKHNQINHINSHLGIKPYPCEGCNSNFTVNSSLTRHRKTCRQTNLLAPEQDSANVSVSRDHVLP